MKIKYTERRIKHNLGYGILMTGLGLVMGVLAIRDNDSFWISLMWLLFGLVQIGTALYEKKNQYLTIDKNKITKHSLFPKTIEIHDIQKVWNFVNSYKIETSKKTIIIDKNVIQEESLYKLADYLNGLKLKVQ